MMKMKLSAIALALLAGATLLALAADSSAPKSTESETIRELRAQITQLRAEVDTLHQRTKLLESTVDDLKRSRFAVTLNPQPGSTAPSTPELLNPAPNASRPPKIWGQGEVNGWTYYIVPCEEQAH